jgi:hypothetical protein
VPNACIRATTPRAATPSERGGAGLSGSRKPQLSCGATVFSVWRSSGLPRRVAIVLWIAAFSLGWTVTATITHTGHISAESHIVAAVTALPAASHAGISGGVDGSPSALTRRDARQNLAFAVVRGLRLMLPHPYPGPVAFHEASKPQALRLYPVGHLVQNNNPGFIPGPNRIGPSYWVLSSRGRGRPATSAVDVVVPNGALITAPVSGRVAEVRQYPLYGRILDWRVAIEPAGYPGLQVVLIHLLRPRVAVGDRVIAGTTPLAAVRLLGFTSQVDDVTHQHLPHTHIEVKLAGDP